ncbi:MAG TPA: 16S rRNA (adenine(1518)-N(6)/adenine(1519)-N(6))-dimethyltransferase RsmA [Syntrophales bacterium]
MSSPLSLLRKYGIRPRKRLGQCFLCDPNILEKIVRIADVRDTDTVVEIGSGIGVLTAMIARAARRVVAVEVDRFLVEVLRKELGEFQNVEIVQTDVLQFDFSSVRTGPLQESGKERIKVIGNVPYNLSSQIVLRLLEYRNCLDRVVLMLQREVAERLAAPPGTKDYGPLSVYVALYTEPTLENKVPAGCFYPRPDVESRVIRLDVRKEPLCRVDDMDFFRRLVRSAFSKRRKTLLNSLKTSQLPVTGDQISVALSALGIDGVRRAETLSVHEFAALSNFLGKA